MVPKIDSPEDLATMYKNFRGRAPTIDAMLVDRGLKEAPAETPVPPKKN